MWEDPEQPEWYHKIMRAQKTESEPPVALQRLVSLRLTMKEATDLCEELWSIGEDERLTPTLRDVYDRVAKAKAKAVQRGCSSAG